MSVLTHRNRREPPVLHRDVCSRCQQRRARIPKHSHWYVYHSVILPSVQITLTNVCLPSRNLPNRIEQSSRQRRWRPSHHWGRNEHFAEQAGRRWREGGWKVLLIRKHVSVNETVMIHGVTYLVGNMSAEGSNHRDMGDGFADLQVSRGGF